MPQFETHFFSSLIFWEIVSFAILFYVLAKYAFPPILEALDARERKIRESIDTAERRRAEADRRLAEYEARMKGAQREADRIKAAAARDIDQERRRALEEVRSYTTDLALRVAEKLLERSLTDADHKRLAEESLAAVAKHYPKS
jgi:F-type H+-transporting ATPase subunit b